MAILKRQRTRKARKIVKTIGIPYGAAIRLTKALEKGIYGFHISVPEVEVDIPTYCDCCGPEYSAAKVIGPKGKLRVSDIKDF